MAEAVELLAATHLETTSVIVPRAASSAMHGFTIVDVAFLCELFRRWFNLRLAFLPHFPVVGNHTFRLIVQRCTFCCNVRSLILTYCHLYAFCGVLLIVADGEVRVFFLV